MLKIRFQRTGRINDAAFRVVVVEHTMSPKSGRFVERLGSYNPKTKVHTIDAERVTYWLSKGAKASDTLHNLLLKSGIIKGKRINILPKRKILAKIEAEQKSAADKAAVEAEKTAPVVEAAPTGGATPVAA